MKKVLVTGGAGFIGGNFIHYILEKYPDYKVYNLDLLTYAGDLTKHSNLTENYYFVKMDISDQKGIAKLFKSEKFDYVVHFAAESHVDRSIKDPESFIKTNVLGTNVLLNEAKKNNIIKFVHISTDEVYGELDFDPQNLFNEDSPILPNSPYSASKASSDLLVRSYFQTYGLPINITRCSNNYGPYHFPEKLIPLTITRALREQEIPIYGEGRNIRDWLHVWDHCSAIDVVLHNGVIGETYNIGGLNERSNIEVVTTILRSLNKSENLIKYVEDRKGHDKRYAINAKKIVNLGWKPKFTFEEGLTSTINWYLENSEWWEGIMDEKYKSYISKQYKF